MDIHFNVKVRSAQAQAGFAGNVSVKIPSQDNPLQFRIEEISLHSDPARVRITNSRGVVTNFTGSLETLKNLERNCEDSVRLGEVLVALAFRAASNVLSRQSAVRTSKPKPKVVVRRANKYTINDEINPKRFRSILKQLEN